MSAWVESVNVSRGVRVVGAGVAATGIDKRAVNGAVEVRVPGEFDSGVVGDSIGSGARHGGPDQAVYAYAREDLLEWSAELGVELAAGQFGENLTTVGVDVTGAEIGERWRVGGDVLLEVTAPRIPCRTFAAWLGVSGWVRTFTLRAVPGAYLRVLRAGRVSAGDPVEVVHRPGHGVTVGMAFRACTTERDLLPRLAGIDALSTSVKERVAS